MQTFVNIAKRVGRGLSEPKRVPLPDTLPQLKRFIVTAFGIPQIPPNLCLFNDSGDLITSLAEVDPGSTLSFSTAAPRAAKTRLIETAEFRAPHEIKEPVYRPDDDDDDNWEEAANVPLPSDQFSTVSVRTSSYRRLVGDFFSGAPQIEARIGRVVLHDVLSLLGERKQIYEEVTELCVDVVRDASYPAAGLSWDHDHEFAIGNALVGPRSSGKVDGAECARADCICKSVHKRAVETYVAGLL
jgi:hypothetical protein